MLDDLQATFSLSRVFTSCLKSEQQGLCTSADLSDLVVCFPNLHTDTEGKLEHRKHEQNEGDCIQNSHKCSRLIDEVRAFSSSVQPSVRLPLAVREFAARSETNVVYKADLPAPNGRARRG